jgi:hypothetical protein
MPESAGYANPEQEQGTSMRETIEARLAALRREYAAGETQLRLQEQQLNSLRETVIRISGAILVLEEILSSSVTDTPSQEFRPTDGLAVVGGQADGSKG